jgi:hypothetical protein
MDIETRKDFDLLVKATECCRELMPIEDIQKVLAKDENVMFIHGNDVGLGIYDYPGVYTVHWYYESRGRQAIDLGKAMTSMLFTEHGAKTLRALIRRELRASRWACRQLGFKSHGYLTFDEDDNNEVLFLTNLKGIK